jgi:hypothetical protein
MAGQGIRVLLVAQRRARNTGCRIKPCSCADRGVYNIKTLDGGGDRGTDGCGAPRIRLLGDSTHNQIDSDGSVLLMTGHADEVLKMLHTWVNKTALAAERVCVPHLADNGSWARASRESLGGECD